MRPASGGRRKAVSRVTPADQASYRLQRRVAAFVRDHQVLRAGERALLMLSGGADSMALLDLVGAVDDTLGLDLTLAALHVDYGMRGADSARDRRIVADACAAAAVPLHVVRLGGSLKGPGFQARARALRYERARELAAADGYDAIVTAHSRDDQAETVLYRLAKYATPRGLAGMRPRDGALARPLLCAGAVEVRDYCRARGIVFGEDVTNVQREYARNRIRLDVLPALGAINPRVVETLVAGAEQAADEAEVLGAATGEALTRVLLPPAAGELAAVDVARFSREPAALQRLVLHALVREILGGDALVERRAVAALLSLVRRRDDAGRATLRGGLEAVRAGGRLRLRRREPAHACRPVAVAVDEAAAAGGEGVALAWCGRRFRVRTELRPMFVRDPRHASVALPAGARRVTLRHPARGERFAPLGLGASTTVARFLAASGAPQEARARALVLDVDGAVAWVGWTGAAGERLARVAQSFRVLESTSSTLHVLEEDT
jgi:tRNA(Ile)-lysidine synthase